MPRNENAATPQISAEDLQRVQRYMHVDPSEFLAVKQELGLSSKECAAAIGRTLSRVSELTKSKGASRAIYENWVAQLNAFRASNPVQASTPAETAE